MNEETTTKKIRKQRSLADLMRIEELSVDRDGRPAVVVECAVDETTTLLIFDVLVPNDLSADSDEPRHES